MASLHRSGEEEIVSEYNINQNESFTLPIKETSSATDPVQDQPLSVSTTSTVSDLIPMEASTSKPDDQASATALVKPSFHATIPVVEITPPGPDENSSGGSLDIDQINLQTIDTDQSANRSASLTMEFLCPPAVDLTINIARPSPDGNMQVSRDAERSKEEDVEVVCRYSSTPVLSPDRSGRNINDTDVSMLSINSASPIAPADTSTPGRSNNQSLSSNPNLSEEGKVFCSPDQQKYSNVLFSDAHVLSQQSEVRESLVRAPVVSHVSQASFVDSGSGTSKHNYSCQDSLAAASYSAGHSLGHFPCLQSSAAYPDYHLGRGASWTDLAYRSDLSPGTPPLASLTDPCCFSLGGSMAATGSCMGGASTEAEYFVYPSIYVSSAGLISVLLRNDISVEMTVDRTIRVVSHNHMMAVATDSRGTAACLYHPAVKVFQMGNTTDIATQNFRAQMGGNDCIVFSNGMNYFRLEGAELQPTAPMKFIDILRDQSVNLLFSSEGYGETLVASCMQVAAQAEYANLPKGGVIVRINGVKVTQTGGGDVTVVTGAKFIRLSPNSGTTRLGNRFVDIEVEKDWTVKLTRGSHSFVYAKKRAMVCNGKMEAGFDENNGLKVNNLAPRHPLLAEPTMVRRPARKPVRPVAIPPPGVCCTPKRRPAPPSGFGSRWGASGIGPI